MPVDVADGADELSEGLLDFLDGELAVLEQIVVQLVAWKKSVLTCGY